MIICLHKKNGQDKLFVSPLLMETNCILRPLYMVSGHFGQYQLFDEYIFLSFSARTMWTSYPVLLVSLLSLTGADQLIDLYKNWYKGDVSPNNSMYYTNQSHY